MSERLKALEKFRDLVVAEAKANLKKMGKDSSGKLSSSIKGEVKAMPNSIGIYFEMVKNGWIPPLHIPSLWLQPIDRANTIKNSG